MSFEIDIVKLENPSEEALQHIASFLGEAFMSYPLTSPTLGGNTALGVPRQYVNVKTAVLGGEAYVACKKGEGAEKALGCAMWYPPGTEYLDAQSLVPERQQMESLLSKESGEWRRDVWGPVYKELNGRCLGTFEERRKMYYLSTLGLAPAAQGQGIGSKLLLHGIARADEYGWTIALNTCTTENVQFYRKFGLEGLGQATIPSAFGDVTLTVMRRSPRTSTQ